MRKSAQIENWIFRKKKEESGFKNMTSGMDSTP